METAAPLLREAVASRLGVSDFQILHINSEPASSGVLGFAGDLLRIRVTVATPSVHGKQHALHFFSKQIPDVLPGEGLNYFVLAYKRESIFYSQILHNLQQLFEEISGCTCKCYFASQQRLILEDLSVRGFRSLTSRTLMDMAHCRILLEKFATFHAASIIFERKKNASIGLQWPMINNDFDVKQVDRMLDGWTLAAINAVESLITIMDDVPNKADVLRRLVERKTDFRRQFFTLRRPSDRFRNVICHGDVWANNMMLRYSQDGAPEDARLIDFQLLRYCPPALDVLSFLHLTTRRAFRDANMEALLRMYHDTTIGALKSRGVDPEHCGMGWEDFIRSCDQLRPDARLTAVFIHPKVLLDPRRLGQILSTPESSDRFINIDRSDIICDSFRNDVEYKNRVTESLQEFIQYSI